MYWSWRQADMNDIKIIPLIINNFNSFTYVIETEITLNFVGCHSLIKNNGNTWKIMHYPHICTFVLYKI